MTAFLNLPAYVAGALAQAPAIASGHVRVGRELPMPQGWDEAVDIVLSSSTGRALTLDNRATRWTTLLGLRIRTRAAAGSDGHTGPDALLADVFNRISYSTPPPGTMAWQLQPQLRWDIDEADQTITQVDLVLAVDHITGGSGLDAAA
jgi:hypothetical protein